MVSMYLTSSQIRLQIFRISVQISGYQDELGGACRTNWITMHTTYWWESVKGRGQLDNLGVDGRIILEWWV
jgi:hypothetical protein